MINRDSLVLILTRFAISFISFNNSLIMCFGKTKFLNYPLFWFFNLPDTCWGWLCFYAAICFTCPLGMSTTLTTLDSRYVECSTPLLWWVHWCSWFHHHQNSPSPALRLTLDHQLMVLLAGAQVLMYALDPVSCLESTLYLGSTVHLSDVLLRTSAQLWTGILSGMGSYPGVGPFPCLLYSPKGVEPLDHENSWTCGRCFGLDPPNLKHSWLYFKIEGVCS